MTVSVHNRLVLRVALDRTVNTSAVILAVALLIQQVQQLLQIGKWKTMVLIQAEPVPAAGSSSITKSGCKKGRTDFLQVASKSEVQIGTLCLLCAYHSVEWKVTCQL